MNMERLTSNKNVSDMSMFELIYNSCYKDDKGSTRYRDRNLDIDSKQLVRNLAKDICNEDLTDLSDEEFDEYMTSMLSVEMDSTIGLLTLFYRNIWAMANLRERLKYYEDLIVKEQNRLIKLPTLLRAVESFSLDDKNILHKLPCIPGDTLWQVMICGVENKKVKYDVCEAVCIKCSLAMNKNFIISTMTKDKNEYKNEVTASAIGETIFFTKEEAEAKLRKLRNEENRRLEKLYDK